MTISLNIPGYKLERMLAKGGMAEVYLAEQLSLGRRVAIKILDAHSGDKEFTDRFLHEARLVAALSHTNLITIYDFGKLDGGKLFLSMEYLQGGDLEERLPKGITEKAALRILRELGSVLSLVHSKGIIHRDIKPANILFRHDETLVLTDFGIAKKVNNDVGLTQAGMMVGSPAYSCPEQLQGLPVDARADVYSVGVLFLEMLTGKNPFKSDTFINTAMNHLQMDTPRLKGNQARFQPLLDKMLAKKPSERYATMDLVLNKLDAIVPITGVQPLPDFGNRRASDIARNNTAPPVPPPRNPFAKNPQINVSATTAKMDSFKDTGLDDFLDDAIKQFDEDDFSVIKRPMMPPRQSLRNNTPVPPTNNYRSGSLPRSSAGKPATPSRNTPTPSNSMRGGNTGNFRNRPLPSNLLGDDEDFDL